MKYVSTKELKMTKTNTLGEMKYLVAGVCMYSVFMLLVMSWVLYLLFTRPVMPPFIEGVYVVLLCIAELIFIVGISSTLLNRFGDYMAKRFL